MTNTMVSGWEARRGSRGGTTASSSSLPSDSLSASAMSGDSRMWLTRMEVLHEIANEDINGMDMLLYVAVYYV